MFQNGVNLPVTIFCKFKEIISTMEDKVSKHQLSELSASANNPTPKYLRMNSTKSELSDKEMTDSGRIDSGFISNSNLDSDFISTCSLLSEDNLSPTTEVPQLPLEAEKVDKPSLYERHSHFDSGVDVDISEPFSTLHLTSSSKIPSSPITSSAPVVSSQTISDDDEYWKTCYTQDEDGDTPLHIAILDGAEALVQHLVQVAPSSACLDVRNDDCQTALHLAVLTGQPRLARHLVLCHANYRHCDRFARTPLHWSVAESNLACVRALTNPISSDELACIKGLKYEPRTSLKNETVNSTDCEGLTCLHLAAIGGNVDIMRQLVLNGGDINAKEWKSGMTALHIAVERADLAMTRLILQSPGLDLEAETFAGFTPYQICYDEKIATLLLDAGVENLPHAEDEIDMAGEEESEEEEEEMMNSLPNQTCFQECLAAVH